MEHTLTLIMSNLQEYIEIWVLYYILMGLGCIKAHNKNIKIYF